MRNWQKSLETYGAQEGGGNKYPKMYPRGLRMDPSEDSRRVKDKETKKRRSKKTKGMKSQRGCGRKVDQGYF